MSLLKEKSNKIIFQKKKVGVYKMVFINSFFFIIERNQFQNIDEIILLSKVKEYISGKKPKLKKKINKITRLGERLMQDPKEKQCLLLTNSRLLEKSLDCLRLNFIGLKTIPQVVSLWETLLSLPSHKKRYIF